MQEISKAKSSSILRLTGAFQKCFDGHDLVITGRDGADQVLPLEQSMGSATVAIFKRLPPLYRSLPEWLPRIHPGDHADLLQNLRQGSRWNGDFVVMLALASAIASFGLLQNSPAVVIGSMLLAPLMTPMIAAGLALAQGNARLGRLSAMSIGQGIVLTLAVSVLIGLLTPSRETLPPEILSRGEPNVLDLFIALLAAVAGDVCDGPAQHLRRRCGRRHCDGPGPPVVRIRIGAGRRGIHGFGRRGITVCDQPCRDRRRLNVYIHAVRGVSFPGHSSIPAGGPPGAFRADRIADCPGRTAEHTTAPPT